MTSRFRPLPPPIPDADDTPVDDLLIVPMSDPARPDGPSLPDRVTSRQRAAAWMRAHGNEIDELSIDAVKPTGDQATSAWLRAEPPPMLVATLWVRVVQFVLSLGALGALLYVASRTESSAPDEPIVGGAIAGAAAALIVWSVAAMRNADALVPATRYQTQSRGWVAAGLWVVGLLAPFAGIVGSGAVRDFLEDPDAQNLAILDVLIVVAVVILAWQPFRYLALQAKRIGASGAKFVQWFLMSALSVVAGQLLLVLGVRDELGTDGLSSADEMIVAGVLFGLPGLLFTLGAWRATSGFDDVIAIRHRRWKTGWEQSVESFGIADEAAR